MPGVSHRRHPANAYSSGGYHTSIALTPKLASKLAAKSPIALQMGKQTFYRMADMEFGNALDYSNEMFASLCITEDAKEGIDAFLNKRKAVWKEK
jgi:enoyl-CoA hydratase/carnithine racemase